MLSYFRSPFPSAEGFSAYRMPGMVVHAPLIFAAGLIGLALCWSHPALRPMVIVWVLAVVYLGRDAAILCHYNPLLTLTCWAGSAFVLFCPSPIAKFGLAHPGTAAVLSAMVTAMQIAAAIWMTSKWGPNQRALSE